MIAVTAFCVSPTFAQGMGGGMGGGMMGGGLGGMSGMGMSGMGGMSRMLSPLDQLKESLRSAKGNAAQKKILAKIQAMLSKQYDSYLQQNEAELSDMEKTVKALRAQLERRKEAKGQLLKLELQRIANEASGLVWPEDQSGMGMGGMGMGDMGMGVPGGMNMGMNMEPMGPGGGASDFMELEGELPNEDEEHLDLEPTEIEDPETKAMNQLRQITIAAHNYESPNLVLPSNVLGENEKPLLSWRVRILQFMGKPEQALYKRFKLDEPWNSEHNIELLGEMPDVFKNSEFDSDHKTVYLGFDGEGAIFNSNRSPIGFEKITDGTSNTIFIAQMNRQSAIPWTKPEDVKFTPGTPVTQLAETADGSIIFALVDGSVQQAKLEKLDSKNLEYLILRNDGNVVSIDE